MRKIFITLIGILTPIAAHAQVHLSDYGFDCHEIGSRYGFDLPGCVGGIDLTVAAAAKVTGTGLLIATPLATVVLLYGAARMIMSKGDEGKEAGKKDLDY